MTDQLASSERPKTLDDFVGQPAAVAFAKGLVKAKRIPNCILISGPSGCGKTTYARLLAALFSGWKGDPDKNPDVNKLAGNVDRTIDDIRAAIQQSRFSPRGGKRRCMIVDEVQGFIGPAASALLEATEEPPEKTTWILCTDQPWKVPRQMSMRSLAIALTVVKDEVIYDLLETIITNKKINLGKKQNAILDKITSLAYGVPRQAIQMLETVYTVLEGGGSANEAVRMAVQTSPTIEAWDASVKFIKAYLADDLIGLIKVVGSSANCDGMIELINKMLAPLIVTTAGGKPREGFGWAAIKAVGKIPNDDLPKILTLQSKFIAALDIRSKYAVPSESLLLTFARK